MEFSFLHICNFVWCEITGPSFYLIILRTLLHNKSKKFCLLVPSISITKWKDLRNTSWLLEIQTTKIRIVKQNQTYKKALILCLVAGKVLEKERELNFDLNFHFWFSRTQFPVKKTKNWIWVFFLSFPPTFSWEPNRTEFNRGSRNSRIGTFEGGAPLRKSSTLFGWLQSTIKKLHKSETKTQEFSTRFLYIMYLYI